MINETVKPQTTFSLAKALHYCYFAKEYFADVIRQENLTGNSKMFINDMTKKLDWILMQCYTRMTPEAAELLKGELQNRDIATIDSILNMIVMLSEEQRLEIEDYIFEKFMPKKDDTGTSN